MPKLSIVIPARDFDSAVEALSRAGGADSPSVAAAEEFIAAYVRATLDNVAEADEEADRLAEREARREARREALAAAITTDTKPSPERSQP